MKNKKIRITVYILAVLPLLVFLILYSKLPDKMPMHWGLHGTVRYDSKNSFFLFAAMPVVFSLMFDFLPRLDPRRQNFKKFGNYYDGFCLFMMIFINGIGAIILTETLRPDTLAVDKFVLVMLSAMFLIIGNMLPTVKSNFYLGIKTPWALSDNEVWNKSNRLGGHLMFWAGVLTLIGTFTLPSMIMFWVLMILVFIVSMIPVVMSYVWYKQKHNA